MSDSGKFIVYDPGEFHRIVEANDWYLIIVTNPIHLGTGKPILDEIEVIAEQVMFWGFHREGAILPFFGVNTGMPSPYYSIYGQSDDDIEVLLYSRKADIEETIKTGKSILADKIRKFRRKKLTDIDDN